MVQNNALLSAVRNMVVAFQNMVSYASAPCGTSSHLARPLAAPPFPPLRLMKRFLTAPLLALAVFGLAACDSSDDSSDKDVFLGTHTATKVEDNVGTATVRDLTAGLVCATADAGPTATNPCSVNSIKFMFRDNGTYSLVVDYTTTVNTLLPTTNCGGTGQTPCRRADVTFDNVKTTYTINESAKTIALQVAATAAATAIPVQASYVITGNNQVALSLPSAVFNNIFATTTYQGTVRVTVRK